MSAFQFQSSSAFQFQSSTVLERLKPFGILFEKSLSDLIKGIRSHSKESPESLLAFLDSAIVECKDELNTTDLETKARAILKLAYLEMYGFEMSWCNFHILEVMSSNKFQQKRIGYLAAIQSFKNEEELLILATNQFKKDLNSHNHVEIGLALSGIATIVTSNLSKDINDDVLMKLTHSKPYIRKKAILAMYKIFLQYPESLRINFHRVIEKLDDDDVSVVSATITVICEISKKNPKIFVNYLPKFFKILEDTKNNWLIIRILKLFQSLSKVEPRMKKKILPSIIDLMVKTQASSLIYECINCIIGGGMLSPDSSRDKETARLCIEQIMNFFQTMDPNLKFVGLLALINTVKIFPTLIKKVDEVPQKIMECLVDKDLLIKRKALEISHYLVTEDSIVDIIKLLLVQMVPQEDDVVPDSLKLEITFKILSIGSQDNYSNIPNFKWYIAVLKDIINLALLPVKSQSVTATNFSQDSRLKVSKAIGEEFKSLATKVPSIRPNILNVIIDVCLDDKVLNTCPYILKDFYWILGEFIDEISVDQLSNKESDAEDDSDLEENVWTESPGSISNLGKKIELLNNFVNFKIDKELELTKERAHFAISTQLIDQSENDVLVELIPALVKLYSSIVNDYVRVYSNDGKLLHEKVAQLGCYLHKLIGFLSAFEHHSFYEVQERALSWLEFLKICFEALVGTDLAAIEKLERDELQYYRTLSETVSDKSESESEEDSSESEVESDSEHEAERDSDYIELSNESEDEQEPEEELVGKEEHNEDVLGTTEESSSDKEPRLLPMLLTQVLPSFFKAYTLNPISKNGQKNILLPEDLDLDTQINNPQYDLLSDDEGDIFSDADEEDTNLIDLEPSELNLKEKEERLNRLKDDPYYLDSNDVQLLPKVKKLIVEDPSSSEAASFTDIGSRKKAKKPKKLKKEKVLILSEEVIGNGNTTEATNTKQKLKKKNLLAIDSSNLDNFDLNAESSEPVSSNEATEYNVDLEALRKKLAETDLEKEAKKKKKSKDGKTKKKSKSKEGKLKVGSSKAKKDEVAETTEKEEVPTPSAEEPSKSSNKKPTSEDSSIAEKKSSFSKDASPASIVVKSLKTKKKKKAVIEE